MGSLPRPRPRLCRGRPPGPARFSSQPAPRRPRGTRRVLRRARLLRRAAGPHVAPNWGTRRRPRSPGTNAGAPSPRGQDNDPTHGGPEMPDVRNARILLMATNDFEQSELEVPRDELRAAAAEVHVASPDGRSIRGWNKTDWGRMAPADLKLAERSEERRVGKECASTSRSWWSQYQ